MAGEPQLPSVEQLHQLLRLDPETGRLYWRPRPIEAFAHAKFPTRICGSWNAQWAGAEALAFVDNHGYAKGAILGQNYKAHRIVWAMHSGAWPDRHIDHINGVRVDNRPDNLREVAGWENSWNQQRRTTNTSGVQGVYRTRAGKWEAKILARGVTVWLGTYADFDAAVRARKAGEQRLGFHPNHGRAAA